MIHRGIMIIDSTRIVYSVTGESDRSLSREWVKTNSELGKWLMPRKTNKHTLFRIRKIGLNPHAPVGTQGRYQLLIVTVLSRSLLRMCIAVYKHRKHRNWSLNSDPYRLVLLISFLNILTGMWRRTDIESSLIMSLKFDAKNRPLFIHFSK